MKDSKDQIARCLNMSDRVEILKELVQPGDTQEADMGKMNSLLEPFYPSFTRFCHDIIGEKQQVTGLESTINDQDVTFTASHEDGSTTDYHYSELDPLFS